MASHTIEVTGISDELLQLLDERVRSQHAPGRADYVRELIRRDVLCAADTPTPQRGSFREILAPVHVETHRQGRTDAEVDQDIDEAIREYRTERRASGAS
jgi:metal-responsive CopG/Arc/MetJ family transcriptional regulator